MTYKIGPDTGDVASQPNQWARLRRGFLGENNDYAGIACSPSQLPGSDPAARGLTTGGELMRAGGIPRLDLGLDIYSDYEIDIYTQNDHGLTKIAGAVFDDSHPKDWLDTLIERRNAILVVGSLNLFTTPDLNLYQDVLPHCHFGILSLLVYASDDGVGFRRP